MLDGSICIRLQGELDLATAPELWSACEVLDEQLERGGSVVLDLADLRFVDAAGLGVLVRLRNRVLAAGAELSVLGPSPWVQRVFRYARLDGLVAGDAAQEGGRSAAR